MALYGSLRTFPLTDLLQWVETSRKTGSLELESGSLTRSVQVRKGRVIGCYSSDPPSLIGQILLARGKISKEQLQEGLATQEEVGDNLGRILIRMGAVNEQELMEILAAKAEEAIYGLFDWIEGSFQFIDDAPFPPNIIEVDISIQDVLLKGLQRFDEMERIRQVFPDGGVILARTGEPLPPKLSSSKASARILEVLDGERTLREILLHCRASEYLVTKFLFELHRQNLVTITGQKLVAGQGEGSVRTEEGETGHELTGELEVASRLLKRKELGAALAVLRAARRAYPEAPSVRELMLRAETEYQEQAVQEMPPDSIPVLVDAAAGLDRRKLSPEEAFLLTNIDGHTNIRSIMWVVPMRAVEILQILKKLREDGIITLREPA